MADVLVTGCAGFIGSQLARHLLDAGHRVRGVDNLNPSYSVPLRRAYLDELTDHGAFEHVEADLRDADLRGLVDGAETIFHLAAVPGVRASWADGFRAYTENNILGTQRVLEAVRQAGAGRVIYASSSSIYGNAERYPVGEDDIKRPHSPYGVSKLAAEHLCDTYADNFGVDVVSLRFFSVYGPRQRPDMGVHRLVESAITSTAFTLYGDGSQVRDMTFVDDVIQATVLAADSAVAPGSILNVAGGSEASVRDLIHLVEEVVGAPVPLLREPARAGDVTRTGGTTDRARASLRWTPRVTLRDGISRQVAWHRDALRSLPLD